MKKTICKREYDTETGRLLGVCTKGSFGDPAGYEERLYSTPDGYYFLYAIGGADSPYPAETIKRMSRDAAEEWVEKNL